MMQDVLLRRSGVGQAGPSVTATPDRRAASFTRVDARDAPAPARGGWPPMGDITDPGETLPIGRNCPVGCCPEPADADRPPWAAFRPVGRKVPMPGRRVRVGREFVRVGR